VARATSISLSKFNATVESAVKAAVQKHPKFNLETPSQLAISYLIWGIPVPELLAATATVRETQAFAAEVASHVAGALPGGVGADRAGGAVFSHGGYLIVGIPVPPEILLER
jgi:hypothetical protein